MQKKLTKGKDKSLAGVCSGIADYAKMDVSIVRVITFLACWFWGTGLLAYIILAIVLPEYEEPIQEVKYESQDE